VAYWAGRSGSFIRDRVRTGGAAVVALLLALAAGFSLLSVPAAGQNLLTFPQLPPMPKPPPKAAGTPMLVQAVEIRYDYTNNTVSAVGNVQIYYNGSTVEADEVIYDQKTKRLQARGNVRITEPTGRITYGQFIDLTQDYRDGFVDSLRLDTYDETHFAAVRADRVNGRYTVMQNGVYTACEPCKDDPQKPPLWQVQAARIIHDNNEKMIYFEDAKVEFFGLPLIYFPFLSAPDPSVARKSGFLYPILSYGTAYGAALEVPYFWALSPSYDLTVTPRFMSMQGVLLQAQWRQRLMTGAYTVRVAGVFQEDPGYFANRDGPDSPTANTFRGAVQTSGQFALSDKWVWGWTGLLMTDPSFLYDYLLASFIGSFDPFHTGVATEGVSQLYLTGANVRSYFDIRTIYYYGFSGQDIQAEIPWIHPVVDYSNVMAQPLLGGELSYKMNLTSLTREQAEFDAITQNALNNSLCTSNDAALINKSNCLLRGIAGTYTRASGEIDWRRTFVTDYGLMVTPFAGVRGDIAQLDIQNQAGTANFINPGDSELARAMPDVGVEYRYPFINVQPWGTQTVEPIAQLILRPNETQIGKFPVEDAQGLVFSDANLFSVDKFSGWDRVEGGGRLNAGVQYTAQVNGAGYFNVLFGQSYQLYGLNSYAVADINNTGLESGLDKTISDYVGRIVYQPNQVFSFIARGRFSSGGYDPGLGENVAEFTPERLEFETRANFGRWTMNVMYGDYAPQPEIGFLYRRQELVTGAAFKVTPNWVLMGNIRYDLAVGQIEQTAFGIGYTDDCLLLSLNYISSYIYTGSTPTPNSTFLVQISLRTLGPNFLAPIGNTY
jgi:LPS-assembly protein